MKNLKEKGRWTMFKPDSREDALNTIDSLISDAIDLVAEIWDLTEDEETLDKLQKLTDINDNIKMNCNEGLKLSESKMKVQEKKVKQFKANFDEKSVFDALDQAFEDALDESLKLYVKALRTRNGAFKVEVDARNVGGTKSTYGCDVTVGLINYEIVSHDDDRDSFVGDSQEELERDAKNYIRDLFKYADLKNLQKKVSRKNESRRLNKRVLKESFEWSEGYDDVEEAETLFNDTGFLASLDGLSDEEIRDAVKEEIEERYIEDHDSENFEDPEFDVFLDSVASEFIRLFNTPIVEKRSRRI